MTSKNLAPATILLLSLISSAAGQQQSCTVNGGPPLVRAEGFTELPGDIVIVCNGGTPTVAGNLIPRANLTVFLNVNVTSRIVPSAGSEALLVIDDPGSATHRGTHQLACGSTDGCDVMGTASPADAVQGIPGPEPFDGTGGRPNIFLSRAPSDGSVMFLGVPFDPPGKSTRVYRIVNLRVLATGVSPSPIGPGLVVALISTSGAGAPAIPTAQLVIGSVQEGMHLTLRDGSDAAALSGSGFVIQQGSGLAPGGTPSVYLRFSEGFSTAFKTRTDAAFTDTESSPPPANQNVPGAAYYSESGFTLDQYTGVASFGTRVKGAFLHIPNGLRVWVGVTNHLPRTRVARLIGDESGAFSPLPSTDMFGTFAVREVKITRGSGYAVWEILQSDPNSTEDFDIPVWFTGNPAAVGAGTVRGSLAPNPSQGAFSASDADDASSTLPIPRFADRSFEMNIVQVTPAAMPPPTIDSVVNGASFLPGIQNNTWVSVLGTNLAGTSRSWTQPEIVNGQLPTSLDGASVTVNGQQGAIAYISPTQINVLAPADSALGPVAVVVRNSAGLVSVPVSAQLQKYAPGLFKFDPQNRKYAAALIARTDGGVDYAGPPGLFGTDVTTRPVKPGETLLLWGTGFGPTSPPVPWGVVFNGAATLTDKVTITVGGTPAEVQFAGVSGAGLYQFNVVVPSVPDGDQKVLASIAGLSSQDNVFVAVAH